MKGCTGNPIKSLNSIFTDYGNQTICLQNEIVEGWSESVEGGDGYKHNHEVSITRFMYENSQNS